MLEVPPCDLWVDLADGGAVTGKVLEENPKPPPGEPGGVEVAPEVDADACEVGLDRLAVFGEEAGEAGYSPAVTSPPPNSCTIDASANDDPPAAMNSS